MRTRSLLVVVAVAVVALVGSSGAAVGQVPQDRVTLTGAQEAPDAGDRNGRGQFSWSLDGDQLCYLLSVRRIATAGAAHIHRGARGVSGPVVLELTAPTPASAACVTVTAAVASALQSRPGRFYVNVHNAKFPGGALRAQLIP